MLAVMSGCLHQVKFIPLDEQEVIDRSLVDSPADTQLVLEAEGLTAPTAICFNYSDGTMLSEGRSFLRNCFGLCT